MNGWQEDSRLPSDLPGDVVETCGLIHERFGRGGILLCDPSLSGVLAAMQGENHDQIMIESLK